MKTLILVYHGIVYSKKNSKRITHNKYTGKARLISSKAAMQNEQDMAAEFKKQVKTTVQSPCAIDIVIYEPNLGRRDLDNQATSILDALKRAEIIADDSFKNIPALSIKIGGISKENPRAEVVIREVRE